MSRYPGDEFVDILGTDIYEYAAPGADLEEAGDRYYEQVEDMMTTLAALGFEHEKLVCFSETGLEGIDSDRSVVGSFGALNGAVECL